MNSSNNRKIEMILGRMEPVESMPGFTAVWEKFQKAGGMPKPVRKVDWRWWIRLIPVPVVAVLIVAVVLSRPFILKPQGSEGDGINNSQKYVKLDWKGHIVALSPKSRWKLVYPDKNSRSAVVYLYSGKILCHPQKLAMGEKFIVMLSDAEVSVQGTIFSVNADAISRRVTVAEGKVRVLRNKDSLTNIMTEGQTLEWKTSGVKQERKADGEDISEMIREISLDQGKVGNWSVCLSEDRSFQSCTGENGAIWFVSGNDLWKLDGLSGAKKIHHRQDGREMNFLSVAGDRILIGTEDGGFLVLDRDGQKVMSITNAPSFRPYAPPYFSGRYIALPTMDANIWYCDIRDGHQETIVAPEGDTVFSTPFIDGDMIYFLTGSGMILKYGLDSGTVKLQKEVFQERLIFPLIRSGSDLVVFERKKGKIAYVDRGNLNQSAVISESALSGIDQVPVVSGGDTYWFDPNDNHGSIYRTDRKNALPAIRLVSRLGSKISGLAVYTKNVYASTVESKFYQVSEKGDPVNSRIIPGRIVGADGDGVYYLNGALVEYYSLKGL